MLFWCKKFEKCNIKIKKIKPTPKSIIHRKPIKISPSSNKSKIPSEIKYIPARYHKVIIFITVEKKNNTIKVNNCNVKISFIN